MASDLGKTTCLECGAPLGPNLRHVGPAVSPLRGISTADPWSGIDRAAQRFNKEGMRLPSATGNAFNVYPYEFGDDSVTYESDLTPDQLARRIGADYGEPV